MSLSLLQVTPKASPPNPDTKEGVSLLRLPSGFSSTLLNTPVLTPAIRLPFITPLKLLAVYSSIPLVFVPQVVIISSTGPSGLGIPGPLQSPSTGFATATGGQSAGSPIVGSLVKSPVFFVGWYFLVLKIAPVVPFLEGLV